MLKVGITLIVGIIITLAIVGLMVGNGASKLADKAHSQPTYETIWNGGN